MTAYVVLTREEYLLEQAADELLASLPDDSTRPAYTERQLQRRGERLRVPVERIANLPGIHGPDFRDELRFLSSVTELTVAEQICLRLWSDGCSQSEIAGRLRASQQRVCTVLRRALLHCYDATPVSFANFCHHTIYRAPARHKEIVLPRHCVACGALFDGTVRRGRFCGEDCAEAGERA